MRNFLDVDEGIRCMIFGYQENIFPEMKNLYADYCVDKGSVKDGEADDKHFSGFEVHKVVDEFKMIKEVLRNNSIPVTADDLENSTDKLRAE